MKTIIGIIAGLVVLFFGIYFGMKFWGGDDADNRANGNGDEQVLCAQDTILCPDGSYVGRVPPSCSFAACPGDDSDDDFEPTAS